MSNSRDIADSAATINFIDGVTSNVQTQLNTLTTAVANISVTAGSLTKTFAAGETAEITLSGSVVAPVVSATKEVAQVGVTNNNWDAAAGSYTLENSAPATTLSWAGVLASAAYTRAFSVASQDTQPSAIAFNTDGTKMFIAGNQGDDIGEYTLSTAFNVSTASFVDSFSVNSQESAPMGLAFNTDGTKMFVNGEATNTVHEYALSTGFDVSTASYTDGFSTAAQDSASNGVTFSTDGTKMFVTGESNKKINEYALSSAFDVSTASFVDGFLISGQTTQPKDTKFNSSGTEMYVVSRSPSTAVYKYTLTTGFDVSTASYANVSFSIANEETSPQGLAFSADLSKMYVCGFSGQDVNEYSLPLVLALGSGSFASTDVGKTINANSGVFVLTATSGSYAQTTTPTSFNQVASGSWSMFGAVYDATADVLEVSNYVGAGFDISGSAYTGVSVQTAQDNGSQGVAFNADGSKMYFIGKNTDSIYQYSLSAPFSLSGASYDSVSFSVSSQDGVPHDFAFNPAGTKLFVLGEQTGWVYQYSLSTAFNIGTANYDNVRFNFGPQESAPQGLTFNPAGSAMFICGSSGDDVNEYALTSAFNVSTASFVRSFSVSAQDTFPSALAFNTDGTVMLILGQTGDAVYSYTLTSGFNISTASFSESFSVSSQATAPTGIAFSATGSSFIICCSSTDYIYEYSSQSFFITTGYQPCISANINSTYWTDINSLTATNAVGDGDVFYAISNDNKTAWSVLDNTGGTRKIVKNSSGTYQYNSNSTYGSETWANATTNTEVAALREAMAVTVNKMNSIKLNAITDANQITLGDNLDFAAILYYASGSTVPTYSGTAINYDANILNQGAVLGTDYNFDYPASTKVRLTAVGAGNYKVRVV